MKRTLLYKIFLLLICLLGARPPHVLAGDAPVTNVFFPLQLDFPQAVVTDVHTIHIPFRLVGRLIAIEARIDTVAGTFFLDTGAERLLLNQNYFEGRVRPGGLSAAIGNTGAVESVLYKRVDSLIWDNLFFLNVNAGVLDLSHIEESKKLRLLGIIGFDVFKDFELFLDFQLQQIILTRLDKNGYRLDPDAMWEIPYDSLGFKLHRHLIVLEARVNDRDLKFSLDTGAELNLLDRKVKKNVLDNFEVLKRVKMMGAGQKQIEVLAGTLNGVVCGNQAGAGMRTLLTNLDEMNVSFGIRLDGVLGYEFLAPRRVLINYKRKKLFFYREQRP